MGVVIRHQAEHVGQLDRIPQATCLDVGNPANRKRCSPFGFEQSLESYHLDRLKPRNLARSQVPRERLRKRRQRADSKRDRERLLVERILAVAQQHECVYPGYCKTSRGISGDGHVNRLVERRWIGKRGNWIDVDRLTGYELENQRAYSSRHLRSRQRR